MKRSLTILLAFTCLGFKPAIAAPSSTCIPEKVLVVQVNKAGLIKIGRDTVSADDLAPYVQERLFKSYLGTGKMHDRIRLEKTDGDVTEALREIIIKEIKEGQRRALAQLCLEKYKNRFDNLDQKKQEKLKKQYPVLFQADYN